MLDTTSITRKQQQRQIHLYIPLCGTDGNRNGACTHARALPRTYLLRAKGVGPLDGAQQPRDAELWHAFELPHQAVQLGVRGHLPAIN